MSKAMVRKRTRMVFTFVAFLLVASLAPLLGVSQGKQDYIDAKKSGQKVRVAVPEFQDPGGGIPANDLQRLTQLTRDTIEMTGFFELVSPDSYPALAASGEEENFSSWEVINVELLVRGDVTDLGGGEYQVEFRGFEVKQARMVVGKRYTGESANFNRMVFKFIDELIEWLTGKRSGLDARIAYISDDTGRNELWVMDTDGSNAHEVTNNRMLNLSPAWAPDGSSIVFTSYANRNPDIHVADPNQTGSSALFAESGLNMSPEYSPDGSKVAFAREIDGNVDIYIMGSSGGNAQRMTTNKASDLSPSWSPDSNKIVFVSDRNGVGAPQLYILNINRGPESGVNPADKITESGTYNTSPAWSPDDKYIAYTSQVGGQFDLYVIDLRGRSREARRITATDGNEENPCWSPDGNFLVYDSDREGDSDIYLMGIAGGQAMKITSSGAKERMPAWSPARTDE